MRWRPSRNWLSGRSRVRSKETLRVRPGWPAGKTSSRKPATALGSADRHAAPQQALRASDGLFVVAVADDAGFERFCRALARPDLLTDARFRSPEQRLAHRAALAAEVERTTRKEPRTYWLGRLDAEGVPAGPVNTCPEALADPHTLARGMVVDLVHPGAGPIKNLGVPVKLSDTPGAVDRPAPLLGEHNQEILAELGYAAGECRRLREAGVI